MSMDLATILAAYSAIVLTIIGGILTFILVHFVPMKSRVSTMWHDLYNGEGQGHIEESEDSRESMRDMLEDAQAQHERQGRRMNHLVHYLQDLSDHLADDEYHDDPPHLTDDNYIDEPDGGRYRDERDRRERE